MKKIFVVKKKDAAKRLDKFLKTKLNQISRSQIKKLIKFGGVLINKKTVSTHYFLKEGEVVQIVSNTGHKLLDKDSASINPAKLPKNLEPKIISETEDFLAVDKPVGLLVHPTNKKEEDTLVNWLIKKYPEIKKVGEEKYRCGIIHRLDRDVSGIMLIAKNNKIYFHLKNQFKNRQVNKKYVAIVYGHMEKDGGKIDIPIGRSKSGKFVAHPRFGKNKFQKSDKTAYTLYSVLKKTNKFSFLEIQILTGRTHQIRAHLSAIGHPILGDQLYKPRKKFFNLFSKKIKVINPGRIMLHSKEIEFKNFNGDWNKFQSPLPQSITQFINEQKIN